MSKLSEIKNLLLFVQSAISYHDAKQAKADEENKERLKKFHEFHCFRLHEVFKFLDALFNEEVEKLQPTTATSEPTENIKE